MEFQYFSALGFKESDIKERLRLFELDEEDLSVAEKLHKLVIKPNLKRIVEEFYEYLFAHKELRIFFSEEDDIEKLKTNLAKYLSRLGIKFNSIEYFDIQLRVGVAHHRIGMPLVYYQCAFQKLHQIIYLHIPHEVKDEIHSRLGSFLLKIVNLDISLAIESYCRLDEEEYTKTLKQLESKSSSLKALATHDPLTNVYNRTSILSLLNSEIQNASADNQLAVVMLDINDLGHINDTLGHFAGDLVIKEVIKRLSALNKNARIGRYGGDEFLMLLSDTDLAKAKKVMKGNVDCIKANAIKIGNTNINMKISQGLAIVNNGEKVESVLQRVFKSLTSVKLQRPNQQQSS